jgi:hypothetical protein
MSIPSSARQWRLIVRPPWKRQPSQDAVDEFDRAIAMDPRVTIASWRNPLARAGFLASSALFKYGGDGVLSAMPAVRRRGAMHLDFGYFAVLMGPQFAKCMPHFLLPATRAVYLFDVWPDVQERILRFIDSFAVDYVFVSASQSADFIRARSAASVHWMPEGFDPAPYRQRLLAERDIDVLQLGRKHEAYHHEIVQALADAGKTYLYERQKGHIVFPTRAGFIDGLARSRISVCVPSSITHPERSGHIETMTLRYLQSMVSKCLVVGHAPAEMVRLFGYNPVVEIDHADPAGQLLEILGSLEQYAHLIERNYQEVLARHTWHHRWGEIADVLFAA